MHRDERNCHCLKYSTESFRFSDAVSVVFMDYHHRIGFYLRKNVRFVFVTKDTRYVVSVDFVSSCHAEVHEWCKIKSVISSSAARKIIQVRYTCGVVYQKNKIRTYILIHCRNRNCIRIRFLEGTVAFRTSAVSQKRITFHTLTSIFVLKFIEPVNQFRCRSVVTTGILFISILYVVLWVTANVHAFQLRLGLRCFRNLFK